MLPLNLFDDDDYMQSTTTKPTTTQPPKCVVHDGDNHDDVFKGSIKADKRRREKLANFEFKKHTNIYYKPEWVCAPGYNYPGPQHIPHKLITAVRADKIHGTNEYRAKRIIVSKKKARRPSKYIFESEQDDHRPTFVRKLPIEWANIVLSPNKHYMGHVERWPRGTISKPFNRSFASVAR